MEDFTVSIGQILKEGILIKDKLIKLEFKPINRFISKFDKYQEICLDFFGCLGDEFAAQIRLKENVDESFAFLKTIATEFKCLEKIRFQFGEYHRSLLLLKKFNLI